MSGSHYVLLIDAFFAVVAMAVIGPVIVYLFTAWRIRRDKLFGFLSKGAVLIYYQQFSPEDESKNAPARVVGEDEQKPGTTSIVALMERFRKDFSRKYGWWRFLLPCAFFAALCLIVGWLGARTLQHWLGVGSGDFILRGIGASAFAGAFMWVVSDEYDRLRTRNFTPFDVYIYVFRIALAVPFGWALSPLVPALAVPLAFFLGGFPTKTLFTISRRFVSQNLKLGEDSQTGALELEKLQCVSKSDAERFQDEGIATIAALAYSDPIDVTIRTNYDLNYVVDCVSQSLLWIYFGENTRMLYPLSLRGAQEVVGVLGWLQDESRRESAEQTVSSAAAVLQMDRNALLTTLHQVADDPYTQFLVQVWS